MISQATEDALDPAFSEVSIASARNTYGAGAAPQSRLRSPFNKGLKKVPHHQAFHTGEATETESDVTAWDETCLEEQLFHLNQSKLACYICGSSTHFSSRCLKYKRLQPADRLKLVKDKKLCTLCLSPAHVVSDCRMPWKCQDRDCGLKHHTSLHGALKDARVTRDAVNAVESIPEAPVDQATDGKQDAEIFDDGLYLTVTAPALLLTPVIVKNGCRTLETYALLDSGSTVTLCHYRVFEALKLEPVGSRRMRVNTITAKEDLEGKVVNFGIRGKNLDGPYHEVRRAVTTHHLPISLDHAATAGKLTEWKHLRDLVVEEADASSVDLLVGQDNAHLLDPQYKVKGKLYEPYAVRTPIGWTIFGQLRKSEDEEVYTCIGDPVENIYESTFTTCEPAITQADSKLRETVAVVCDVAKDHEAVSQRTTECAGGTQSGTEPDLKRFWEAEEVPEADLIPIEVQHVLERWNKEFRVVNGHIELPIPFKVEPPEFPDNLLQALRSLEWLERQFRRDSEYWRQYRTAMAEYFTEGHAEVVGKLEKCSDGGYCLKLLEGIKVDLLYRWFLLHHGVKHARKPGVTRVVKNGAGKFMGRSLNDTVFGGPDLLNSLVGVLINFRRFKHATGGDVKGMFNQVLVPEGQRDCQSFVWWEDGDPSKPLIVCRMRTHIFGTNWAPAAAMFALRKTAEVFGGAYSEEATRAVLKEFYVDDWLNSEDQESQSEKLAGEVTGLLENGGFSMMKFMSTSKKVLSSIEPRRRAKDIARLDLDLDALPSGSTLGVGLDFEKDEFFFNVKEASYDPTRRGLMSSLASLYDPMGLLSPFTFRAKMLVREACKRGGSWDEHLPSDIQGSWGRWLQDLEVIKSLRFDRWLGCDGKSKVGLCHCSDGSEQGYGSASYLCTYGESGKILSAKLVLGRSKLAPLKVISIPRMELCGGVLAVKADIALKRWINLELVPSQFWTDSNLLLFYLEGDPAKYQTFMGNRSSFIQSHTDRDQWKFIPGTLNPADLVSRGVRASEMLENHTWENGPDFWRDEPESWPRRPAGPYKLDPRELKQARPVYSTTAMDEAKTSVEERLKRVMNHYSDVKGTAKALSWILRFCMHAVKKGKRKEPLTVDEIQSSRRVLDQLTQEFYLRESQVNNPTFKKEFAKFDDGLWRVIGRADRSNLDRDVKHPVVVPEGSPLAKQLIKAEHLATHHAGVDRMLIEVRASYWIISARKQAKAIKKACVWCRRWKGKLCQQRMGDLPKDRLEPHTPPFHNTGVDLFGPVHVNVKRSTVKRYGALFTCLTSRAVHLEPVSDLSRSGFIDCLERFCSRRGVPVSMRSDNGKNFVSTRKELNDASKLLESDGVQKELVERGIRWLTNTPSTSHQGGVWERLIRSTRDILQSVTRNQHLTDDKWHTVLCMAEQQLNSRPITRLTDDSDSLLPLTPNHLLTQKKPRQLFSRSFSGERYCKDWRQVQGIATAFWRRWVAQYLPTLHKRRKWNDATENLVPGELVLLQQDNVARGCWPLGVIQQTFPGADGLVRNVAVRTTTGVYRRPVNKVLRLEGDRPDVTG